MYKGVQVYALVCVFCKIPQCPLIDVYLVGGDLYQPITTRVARAHTLYPHRTQGNAYTHGTQLFLDAAVDTFQDVGSCEKLTFLALQEYIK